MMAGHHQRMPIIRGGRSGNGGSEVVGMAGPETRPLGGGAADLGRAWAEAIGTDRLLAFKLLWPSRRRLLERLLPPVDGQVEQTITVIHRLDAAHCGPVSLEHTGSLSQVANDVHHAHPAFNQKSVERVLGRVPGH